MYYIACVLTDESSFLGTNLFTASTARLQLLIVVARAKDLLILVTVDQVNQEFSVFSTHKTGRVPAEARTSTLGKNHQVSNVQRNTALSARGRRCETALHTTCTAKYRSAGEEYVSG